MDDFRLYVNPQPRKGRFSAAWQREHLPEGEEYLEDKSGKVIDALIRSVRPRAEATEETPEIPASVVVVRRLFCLAPWAGTPTVRKREMARRIDRIKERGGAVMEGETGRRTDDGSCAQMIVDAVLDIQNAGRRALKRPGAGRPPIELTPLDLERAEAIWRSREHANDKARIAAIEAKIGKRLKRGWLWDHFGSPTGRKPQT